MDAFVILDDGSYQPVTGYDLMEEVDKLAYFDGNTYRDLFDMPTDVTTTSITSGTAGVYWPAIDGQSWVSGGSNPAKAHMSDEYMHEPLRASIVKQTRLRFYKRIEYLVTADTAADVILLPAGHVVANGDQCVFNAANGLPSPLVHSTVYYAPSVSLRGCTVNTTGIGAGLNLTTAGTAPIYMTVRKMIAEFKPGQWVSWSNTKPVRF